MRAHWRSSVLIWVTWTLCASSKTPSDFPETSYNLLARRLCFIWKRAKSGQSGCPIHLKIVLVFGTVRRKLLCVRYVTFFKSIYFLFIFLFNFSNIAQLGVWDIVYCFFSALVGGSLLNRYIVGGDGEIICAALAINKIKIKVFGQVRVDQLIIYLLYYSSVIQKIFRY